jgi:hypothetical protein
LTAGSTATTRCVFSGPLCAFGAVLLELLHALASNTAASPIITARRRKQAVVMVLLLPHNNRKPDSTRQIAKTINQ